MPSTLERDLLRRLQELLGMYPDLREEGIDQDAGGYILGTDGETVYNVGAADIEDKIASRKRFDEFNEYWGNPLNQALETLSGQISKASQWGPSYDRDAVVRLSGVMGELAREAAAESGVKESARATELDSILKQIEDERSRAFKESPLGRKLGMAEKVKDSDALLTIMGLGDDESTWGAELEKAVNARMAHEERIAALRKQAGSPADRAAEETEAARRLEGGGAAPPSDGVPELDPDFQVTPDGPIKYQDELVSGKHWRRRRGLIEVWKDGMWVPVARDQEE